LDLEIEIFSLRKDSVLNSSWREVIEYW